MFRFPLRDDNVCIIDEEICVPPLRLLKGCGDNIDIYIIYLCRPASRGAWPPRRSSHTPASRRSSHPSGDLPTSTSTLVSTERSFIRAHVGPTVVDAPAGQALDGRHAVRVPCRVHHVLGVGLHVIKYISSKSVTTYYVTM